jgi:hypothetical protein
LKGYYKQENLILPYDLSDVIVRRFAIIVSMHPVNEILSPLCQSYSQHIHSLYLIGSVASDPYNQTSDLDIVCLVKPATPLSIYKLILHELMIIGLKHQRSIDPYLAPIDAFLGVLPCTSMDFMVRAMVKEYGYHIAGEKLLDQLPQSDAQEIWTYQYWLGFMLYQHCTKLTFSGQIEADKKMAKELLSLLSTLAIISKKVPVSLWFNKSLRLKSLAQNWPEGEMLQRSADKLYESVWSLDLLKLAEKILEEHFDFWKLQKSLILIKPIYDVKEPYFNNLFLLTEQELGKWKSLAPLSQMKIDRPYERLSLWWKANKI